MKMGCLGNGPLLKVQDITSGGDSLNLRLSHSLIPDSSLEHPYFALSIFTQDELYKFAPVSDCFLCAMLPKHLTLEDFRVSHALNLTLNLH